MLWIHEKTRLQKSHATVPLSSKNHTNYINKIMNSRKLREVPRFTREYISQKGVSSMMLRF